MTPNIVTTVLAPAVTQFRRGAPFDLCSLEDVREELRLEGQKDDGWLRRQISAESETISRFCNRIFQVQAYQDHFWPFRDSVPRKLDADLLPLQLARWPIANGSSQAGVAPPQAPTLSAVPGGALAAARYYARITYVTPQGETAASLESNLAVAAGYLPQIASPVADPQKLATGWNCYLGDHAGRETLQNASPIEIGTDFTLPDSGLSVGAALPNFLFVAEMGVNPYPLVEGTEFLINAEVGQLERLHPVSGHVRSWPSFPIVAQYRAGFAEIPLEVQNAAVKLVKMRWFMRPLDPMVKSSNVEGIYQEERWLGTGPGGPGDMPSEIADKLMRYRVPVVA